MDVHRYEAGDKQEHDNIVHDGGPAIILASLDFTQTSSRDIKIICFLKKANNVKRVQ